MEVRGVVVSVEHPDDNHPSLVACWTTLSDDQGKRTVYSTRMETSEDGKLRLVGIDEDEWPRIKEVIA
jgi:hypothetical protein